MLALFAAVTLSLASTTAHAPAADSASVTTRHPSVTWQIDPVHSELRFRIRHFVSRVAGTFTDWDGTISGEPGGWAAGSVNVAIRTASVSTRNERRDNHLRSADFFDVAKYPVMTFSSTAVTVNGSAITVAGDLTLKGVTKPVTLTGEVLGVTPGQDGRARAGFEVSTTINRLDYGVSWNRAVEGGGVMLGDEVTIEITIEAVKQGD